jgi:hypothetical protein
LPNAFGTADIKFGGKYHPLAGKIPRADRNDSVSGANRQSAIGNRQFETAGAIP